MHDSPDDDRSILKSKCTSEELDSCNHLERFDRIALVVREQTRQSNAMALAALSVEPTFSVANFLLIRMPAYKSRQSLYLRISLTSVLQMTLCLDERHCGWMSDAIMERVIAALKSRIGPKLRKEAKEGKEKVDVYRGAGWQMAYFYRKSSTRHAVMLKVCFARSSLDHSLTDVLESTSLSRSKVKRNTSPSRSGGASMPLL